MTPQELALMQAFNAMGAQIVPQLVPQQPAAAARGPAGKPAAKAGTGGQWDQVPSGPTPQVPAAPMPAPVAAPPVFAPGVSTGPVAPQGGQMRTVCTNGKCQEVWQQVTGAPHDAAYINQIAGGGPVDPITAGFMANYSDKSQQSRTAAIRSGDTLYQQQLTRTPQFQAAFQHAIRSGAATPAEAAAIAFGQVGMQDVVARNPNDLTEASASRYKRTAPQFVAMGQPAPFDTPGFMNYYGAVPQPNGDVLQSFGLGGHAVTMPTGGGLAPATALQFMQLPQLGAGALSERDQRSMLEYRAKMAQVDASRKNNEATNASRAAATKARNDSAERRTAATNQTRKDTAKGGSASKFDPKKVTP
jgi:hypothetical protein